MADILAPAPYLTGKDLKTPSLKAQQPMTHQTEMSCQPDQLHLTFIEPSPVRFAITQVRLMPHYFFNIASSSLLTINSTGFHVRATTPHSLPSTQTL
jgi:hypothetical protein